tara:strand:+ start:9669 stop:10895 length:1227 start_codon:yes stop_codon:yes gene_type:complete
MKSIFVQIASYRDSELIPTIDNLLQKAKNPERLKICIAHQYSEDDEWDRLDKYADDSRFIVIQIPHDQSGGVCWARNQIQQHYNGEDYTLHLDSHHRFIKDWDEKCINMLSELIKSGIEKPMLTTYSPSYNSNTYPDYMDVNTYGMRIHEWIDGVPMFHPNNLIDLTKPMPSRFYSGHFSFTLGKFCKEVPHDPLMYFHGEEISISVRAYTHGYDMFIPNIQLIWHEYRATGRKRHWDDHQNWDNKNKISKSRVRQLLGVDGEVCSPCNENTFKLYGLGKERTLEDYELYAGINFRNQSVTVNCKQNHFPPGHKDDLIYTEKKTHAVKLNKNDFPYNDYAFAILVLEDIKGAVVHNETIGIDTIKALQESSNAFINFNSISTAKKPLRYFVWGYSEDHGWGDKLISYF